jgi:hypothetical protein
VPLPNQAKNTNKGGLNDHSGLGRSDNEDDDENDDADNTASVLYQKKK